MRNNACNETHWEGVIENARKEKKKPPTSSIFLCRHYSLHQFEL
jgi:hypothetical protein